MAALNPSTLNVINNIGHYRDQIGALITGRQTAPKIERSIDELLEAALDLRAYSGPRDTQCEVVEFRIKGVVLDLLRNVPYFLSKKGLLRKAYQVMPDPTACSELLRRTFLECDSKPLKACAAEVLDLGGVMTTVDMNGILSALRHYSSDSDEPFVVQADFVIKLIENMSKAPWFNTLEQGDNDWVKAKFIIFCLGDMINGKHSKLVINHILNNDDVYKSAIGEEHDVIKSLALSANSHKFYEQLAAASPEKYENVMRSSIVQSSLTRLIGMTTSQVDMGKLSVTKKLPEIFFLNSFRQGIARMKMSENEYRGLQKHWKSLKYGNGKSLAEAGSCSKEVKEQVKNHLAVVELLDNMCKDPALLRNQNSIFLHYVHGDYRVLEKLFIQEDKRISDSPSRKRALLLGILNLGDMAHLDYIEKNRDMLQDPEVVNLMTEMIQSSGRYSRDRKEDFCNYVVGLMLQDDPKAKPFESISKATYELLIDGRDDFGPERVRQVNWKSSELKRQFLESDMEL